MDDYFMDQVIDDQLDDRERYERNYRMKIPNPPTATLTAEQFARLEKNPEDDQWLRDLLKIPEDKYYSVSVWPTKGNVTIQHVAKRTVKAKKISKSP